MIAQAATIVRRLLSAAVGARTLLAGVAAGSLGTYALVHYPFPTTDPVFVLTTAYAPAIAHAVETTYRVLWFSSAYWGTQLACALLFVFVDRTIPTFVQQLPPYPPIRERRSLALVLGELHHPTEPVPSPTPQWLTIPARGCHAGIAVIGATGSGKTAGCLHPFAAQLLGYAADDPHRKLSGLVLEVKGDFCAHVRRILARHGREQDYFEINLRDGWRYNPLDQPDLDAYALAYTIASLMAQVWGRGKEPFWELATTNLVQFVILLHLILYEYVTFVDVYSCAINPRLLEGRIKEAGRLPSLQPGVVTVPLSAYATAREASEGRARWEPHADGTTMRTEASPRLLTALTTAGVPFTHDGPTATADRKRLQWEAVRLWYEQDWMELDQKLRTSIVEGLSAFIGVFFADPDLRSTFCPPKRDPDRHVETPGERVLPPFSRLIEEGRVCALNFPVASNPAIARTIGTLLKMDFQRAMLQRIPRISEAPDRIWRDVLFMVDEYQVFATAGQATPGGDEQFFALSRQSRCIPIVATQGVSSLASMLPGQTWRPLLAQFRTKIITTQTDDMTAQYMSDLCGRIDTLKRGYNISETGRDANISLLTGRAVSKSANLGTTTTTSWQREPLFETRVFTELRNMEAITLAYDGLNPLRPQRLYLKPYYLPVQRTHFEHLAAGAL